jgi:hypothetical protein
VLGKDDQGFIIPELYSNPFNIVSKPLEAPKLKSPKIIREEEGLLYRIWKWILPEASADESTGLKTLPKNYKAEFQWEKVDGASGYNIEISETPDFRNLSLAARTSSPHFIWKNFKLAPYYWRVAAVAEDGELGLFSEVAPADLTSIPLGPITPGGIRSTQAKALVKPTPIPTAVPAPIIAPTKAVAYHPFNYSVEFGGHYIYEVFEGSDFKATNSGPYLGDVRLTMASPFEALKAWRGELEFQHEVLTVNNTIAFPFQQQGINFGVDLSFIKESPYEGHYSWGFGVLNEYAVFQRAALEDLSINFPILVGPLVDWHFNSPRHETDYRLGAYLGGAFALEGRASYIFLFPMGAFTTTATFELGGTAGVTNQTSYWGSGTGMFYLGVRW